MAGHRYEFGGPLGVLVIICCIPIITYLTEFLCRPDGCPPKEFYSAPWEIFKRDMWPGWHNLFDWEVMIAFVEYFLLLLGLQYALPGRYEHGTVLKDGTRLAYKINAAETFTTLLALCAAMTYHHGASWDLWIWLWDHNLHLVTAANIFCFAMSIFLYIYSFRPGNHLLAEPGTSGNPLYDWWMGRELNPRIGTFDFKVFCELRPGLMGWIFLDLSNAAKQYRDIGRLTDSMILIIIFQFWYVFDSHWNEPAALTTMDITSDGFGHMLVFGDLAWVPFVYSFQTRFLAMHPLDLGPYGVACVLLVQAMGYYIFRSANNQKNKFRNNPDDPSLKNIKYINTQRGTKLMISGWWGIARHINYLGDWIMAWAFCLPTGFSTPLTYFFIVYFAILLIHRDRRDDEACAKKYGKDWEKYKRIVKYRIFPGIY